MIVAVFWNSYHIFISYWRCPLIGDRLHWHIFGNWHHIGWCGADSERQFICLDWCDTCRSRPGLNLGLTTVGCCGCRGSSRPYRNSRGRGGDHGGRGTRWYDVSSGRAGQSDGHHVALVAGDAVGLQLGNEASVFGVLEQLAYLLVLLWVHGHIVLCEATFAISADFPAEKNRKAFVAWIFQKLTYTQVFQAERLFCSVCFNLCEVIYNNLLQFCYNSKPTP